MISLRIFNHSSFFRLFLICSIAIFLVPSNDQRTTFVSAVVWNFGPRDYPDDPTPGLPVENDYPSDDATLSRGYRRPPKNKGVIFISVAGMPSPFRPEPLGYCIAEKKMSIYNAFPDLIQVQLSSRWYDGYMGRLWKWFLEDLRGEVFLLSKYPLGPPNNNELFCTFWWYFAFPTLKENTEVNIITLVDPQDYDETTLYWRRDGRDPDPKKPYEDPQGPGTRRLGAGRGFGNNPLNFLPEVGGFTGAAAILGGTAVPALGAGSALSNVLPMVPPPVLDGTQGQSSATDPTLVDPLDKLPENIYPPAVRGKTSMTPSDGTTEFPSFNMFQRRGRRGRRDLLGPPCLDWSGWPNDVRPTFSPMPNSVRPTVGLMPNPDINPGPSVIEDPPQVVDSPFSTKDYVTVKVTQYDRHFPSALLSDPTQPDSPNFRLDITILDPAGQTSGKPMLSADAPSGQKVDYYSPVLYSPFHVTTGNDLNAVLQFQLGQETPWDSDSTGEPHHCSKVPWADGKRRIYCSFQIQEDVLQTPNAQPPGPVTPTSPGDPFHLQIDNTPGQPQNPGTPTSPGDSFQLQIDNTPGNGDQPQSP